MLALESKELIKSVRALLDMDCKFSAFFHFFKKIIHLAEEDFKFDNFILLNV